MAKTLPDKWIRKAIYDSINGMVVNSKRIPCYDSRVNGNQTNSYVILSTQTADDVNPNKCGHMWQSSILIEVFTRYALNDNTGSRTMADDILNMILILTDDLVLDAGSGLKIQTQTQTMPRDLMSTNVNEVIYRKFVRIEFLIN